MARTLLSLVLPVIVMEYAVSATIGSYLPSLLNSAQNAYAFASATPNATPAGNDPADPSSTRADTANVTLSDAARAHLANNTGATTASASRASLTASARSWFDAQYERLGTTSAMLDGQVAVDLREQSRATLAVVVSDTQGTFSADERQAAGIALQSRFDDAMAPHVVIARHTGDYASLYREALAYLEQAGAAERATPTWQGQQKAVTDGLAAARSNSAGAPDTGNENDPVRALLDTSAAGGANSSDATAAARAMLDEQENAARDRGSWLAFDADSGSGQPVDFSRFDNRSLAAIVLNRDESFTGEETRAAKYELSQRNRAMMLEVLTSGSGADGSLDLLRTYSRMSEEEKAVLGITEAVTNRVVENYRTQMAIQNTFGGNNPTGIGNAPQGILAYL